MMVKSSYLLSSIMMKVSSSISPCKNLILSSSFAENIGNVVINFLCRLIYLVCKWILYVLDILFFYIRQISGMNVDTSSLDALSSGDSDLVFKLINENSSLIRQIIRQLVGLAIVVIIILAIIAIIKTQYEAVRDGKAGDNNQIISNTLKSLLMLIITPAIAIGGIMMSNILLKSLYNATNVTEATSLGSSIFALSSSSANQYRLYAQNGKRIPVYFEFSENEFYLDSIEENQLTQKSYDYLSSPDNPTYQAHLMFEDETFFGFDELEDATTNKYRDYYKYYDIPANRNSSQNQHFMAEREEYLVMADFIDFAVKTSNVFYFKTIEEILAKANSVPNGDIYRNIINSFGIYETPSEIQFTNNYYRYDPVFQQSSGEVKAVQYKHTKGAVDELYGAVYIVTIEKTIEVEGKTYIYYEPFTYNSRDVNDTTSFKPEFLKNGSMVVAKGLFKTTSNSLTGLPTAIRQSSNGDIEFYRDDLYEYSLGDVAGFAQLYQQSNDNENIFSRIIQFFNKLFNKGSFSPVLDVNEQAVKVTYKKQTNQIGALENGRLHISYLFNKSDSFTTSIYTVQFDNFFVASKLNLLILVMGSWMLFKVCITVIFALIKRIYDLFLLFVFYPAACATMPIDGGSGHKQWMGKFTAKLFLTYGLIIGINVVLIFVPIAESIEFFKPEEIATNTFVKNLSALFFNLISFNQIANAMNLMVAVLFELVAFSMLTDGGIVSLLSQLFPGGEDITTQNPGSDIATVMASMTNVTTQATKMITGVAGFFPNIIIPSRRKALAEKTKTKLERAIPGNEALNRLQDMKYRQNKKKEQKDAYKELEDALEQGDVKEIEAKLKAFTAAQENYTKTLTISNGSDSVKQQRKAEGDRKKNDEFKEFASNSREEGSGAEGNNDSDSVYDGYSDKELTKLSKKAKKFEKKNRKKYNKGQLSEEEEKKYLGAKKLLENGENILNKRNSQAGDIEKAKQDIATLENKRQNSGLTSKEEDTLTSLKDKVEDYNKNNYQNSHKYKMQHDKKYRKEYNKMLAEKERQDNVFAHEETGKYGRQQRKILKDLDSDIVDARQNLQAYGINSTDPTDLENALNDNTVSDKQKEAIKQYLVLKTRRDELNKIRDSKYEMMSKRKTRVGSVKDQYKITNGGLRNKIRNRARNKNLLANQNELDEINNQINNIDKGLTGDGSVRAATGQRQSIKEEQRLTRQRSKLVKRKAELESKINISNNWNSINNQSDIARLKKEHKEQIKRDKFFDKYDLYDDALVYLAKNKLPATQENIDKYTDMIMKYVKNKKNKG